MADTDAAADAALAAVLDDTPSDTAWDTTGDPWAGLGTDVAADTPHVPVAPEAMLCTADEARTLVAQVRAALNDLDRGLSEIVARRAWEPLGYANAREFVLAELGPSNDGTGRVSRGHAYRLARIAMFLYHLAARIGDDAVALDLPERALRAIPAGRSGANDDVLIERIAERVEAAGPDLSPEAGQAILDSVLAEARAELDQYGHLTSGGPQAAALDGLALDPATLTPDSYPDLSDATWDALPDEHDTGGALDDAAGFGADAFVPDAPEVGASRDGMLAAHGGPPTPSDASVESAYRLSVLMRALSDINDVKPHLPELIEYATDDEIRSLSRMGEITDEVTEQIVAAARGLADDHGL